jgi:hypothetical protein
LKLEVIMLTVLQLIALFLVAITMTCSLGHALELPGKLRLPKETYLAVQPIYYPGFTLVGGFAEVGAVVTLIALLFVTPQDSAAFALSLSAFVALVLLEAIFWIFIQPVNKVWLKDQNPGAAGNALFRRDSRASSSADWTTLRNRWEYSHLVRGVLATAALMLLATAIASA